MLIVLLKKELFTRKIFNRIRADCLISGAFGFFRKETLKEVGGYSEDTVGEDMDVVLKLQKKCYGTSRASFVYEKRGVCYTKTPGTAKRLMHQRDRWQRGLLDCLVRHRNMLFNPQYGALGFVVLPYELVVELVGPFFVVMHAVNLICAIVHFEWWFQIVPNNPILSCIQSWWIYIAYLVLEIVVSVLADYDSNKKLSARTCIQICFIIMVSMLWSVPLAIARIYGMLTFHWRKMVW